MTRLVAPVLASAALALVACSPGPAAGGPSPGPAGQDAEGRVAQVRDELDSVADLQTAADTALGSTLGAVRELDAIVPVLREAATVDQGVAAWPGVDAAYTSARPDELRDGLIRLALRIDEARAALNQLRGTLDTDWEQRYLDAEDDVLVTLRSSAEAADALARALITHWPTYTRLHDDTAGFVQRRSFFRTPQEAADAYELVVQPLLADLASAQADVSAARDLRDVAAEEVNEAVAAAREIYAERPDEDT